MNKNAQKRLKLFQTFSQNLTWLREQIKFVNHEFKDEYICPLCLTVTPILNLNITVENPLTLEDVPPASLGGKPVILTCKKCNSESGHNLDNHLLNRLLELDFAQRIPGSKINTKFKVEDNTITGTFEYNKGGSVVLDLHPKRSDPKKASKFMGRLITYSKSPLTPMNWEEKLRGVQMSFTARISSDETRAEIALLRIAYFLAFKTLGYGYILLNNPGLNLVRRQILNPDEKILQKPYWIKYDFSDEDLGINIIKEPKELRSFLIVFDLKTTNKSRRCGIVLPGAFPTGGEVYQNIPQILGADDRTNTNLTFQHVADIDEQFLSTKPQSLASHIFWKEYVGD